MISTDYQFSFTTDASPAEVADKIGRVSEWWTRNFTGRAQYLGDQFTVTFGETFVTFLLAEKLAGKLVWQVTDCCLPWLSDRKEWQDTRVVWNISSDNGRTTVRMTHVGLARDVECYSTCERGWNFYLGESLQKFVSEGCGLPDMHKARQSAVHQ